MTAGQWKIGRKNAGLTQAAAARLLAVSQPYLSQLETGLRAASAELARRAAKLYGLPPTALPLPEPLDVPGVTPGQLQRQLASLGYPGFEHVRSTSVSNPAGVVLNALVKRDLDARLVEALPWVLSTYTDLNWEWLRDRAKLHNAQNRLGYVVHLAEQTVRAVPERQGAVAVLTGWVHELEEARLAREGTLCRDSMPERERAWVRANRPEAAVHWNLLTSLTAEQLRYATY
ncbi:putative Transcriptional regulator, XRE family [Candidatus Sulfopaludibacter sp. SbA4]|nr:putative Transcriptional regulator, XRE family [Candidatus Sulfopaludibacter sp. SbA4]